MGNARIPRRSGGRATKQIMRAQKSAPITAYIDRKVPTYQLLSEDGLALIEHNAEHILKEVGMEFRGDEEALRLWHNAGADIQGERVRFPQGLCKKLIQDNAPSEFVQWARNPEKNVYIGGSRSVFAPVYGPPFVHDLDRGRRYATLEDFENFVKLGYLSPAIHHSGGTLCEPVDKPVNKRHLDMLYSHLRWSDKPFMGSVTHPDRAEDSIAMAKLVFGEGFTESHCVLSALININSPLTFDETMLSVAKVYAIHGQATVISPFILAGAMSPVTVLGTVTQLYAEALAGMAFIQLVRPGAPVVFGTFASAMSMQSGAPTFGTPEPSFVLFIAAALARRLGVPFRSGGALCAAKLPDAQAAYESANTLQSAMFAGVNFMLHTAGWLEGGLAAGYEKFVMDADQAAMLQVFLHGVDMSESAQALEAIAEVGPGQHHLGSSHTRAHFESAFYRSSIADNNSYEQWVAEGSLDAATRANAIWKKMLARYEPPLIDPGINESLHAFIDKRKASMPDATH